MLLRSPFLRLDKSHGVQALQPSFAARVSKKFRSRSTRCAACFRKWQTRRMQLRERQHPSEWCAAFSKLLRHAGWPGDRPLSPAEHQTVEHWKNLLSELASLDAVLPRITYSQALQRLRAHRSRSALRPSRRRRAGADHGYARSRRIAIRCVVDRGTARRRVAQRRRAPILFCPCRCNVQAGMPHSSPERELDYARRVTARLLASAPRGRVQLSIILRRRKTSRQPAHRGAPRSSAKPNRRLKRPCGESSQPRFRWSNTPRDKDRR